MNQKEMQKTLEDFFASGSAQKGHVLLSDDPLTTADVIDGFDLTNLVSTHAETTNVRFAPVVYKPTENDYMVEASCFGMLTSQTKGVHNWRARVKGLVVDWRIFNEIPEHLGILLRMFGKESPYADLFEKVYFYPVGKLSRKEAASFYLRTFFPNVSEVPIRPFCNALIACRTLGQLRKGVLVPRLIKHFGLSLKEAYALSMFGSVSSWSGIIMEDKNFFQHFTPGNAEGPTYHSPHDWVLLGHRTSWGSSTRQTNPAFMPLDMINGTKNTSDPYKEQLSNVGADGASLSFTYCNKYFSLRTRPLVSQIGAEEQTRSFIPLKVYVPFLRFISATTDGIREKYEEGAASFIKEALNKRTVDDKENSISFDTILRRGE